LAGDKPEAEEQEQRRKAVALRYDDIRDSAPRVVAKGRGRIAERIIEAAEEAGVPIHEDADLVEVLSKLELDQIIPPALYQAVAEVLAFLYRLNSERKSKQTE
jgi:flagellar biosynthesis protein